MYAIVGQKRKEKDETEEVETSLKQKNDGEEWDALMGMYHGIGEESDERGKET